MNGLGVAEAEVVTEGDSNIVISVPGDDGEQARELGADRPAAVPSGAAGGPEPAGPAATEQRRLDDERPATPTDGATPTDRAGADGRGDPAGRRRPTRRRRPTAPRRPARRAAPRRPSRAPPPVTQEEAAAQFATLTCEAENVTGEVSRPDDYVATCSEDGAVKYLLGPTIIEGTEIDDASGGHPRRAPASGSSSSTSTTRGSGRPGRPTPQPNIGQSVGITLDGRVISAPFDQLGHLRSAPRISGSFDQEVGHRARQPAPVPRLPLSFTQATAQSISTELGSEQMQAGSSPAPSASHSFFLYSLIYYRLLGVVMIASLRAVSVVVYACLVLLGRQIGHVRPRRIGASSFAWHHRRLVVVYFERIKDEIREGRSFRSAVPRAWVRARRTIRPPTRSASWPRRSSTCWRSVT